MFSVESMEARGRARMSQAEPNVGAGSDPVTPEGRPPGRGGVGRGGCPGRGTDASRGAAATVSDSSGPGIRHAPKKPVKRRRWSVFYFPQPVGVCGRVEIWLNRSKNNVVDLVQPRMFSSIGRGEPFDMNGRRLKGLGITQSSCPRTLLSGEKTLILNMK